MGAPRLTSSGQIEVTSTAKMDGRLELFGYGQRDDIPNPGDLLIVTTNFIRDNFKIQEVEFKLRIRGRDMAVFIEAARGALILWDDNKHWLQASASQPGVDTRSISTQRSESQSDAIKLFYARNQ